ncbi:MAG: 4a-hydroxytetrahydrobiopterin dehydratase [Fimbriimonas sp.]
METLAYRKLDEAEAQARLAEAPGWSIEDGKLTKSFKFESYKDGVVFGTAVAYLSDRLDHHPDLEIGYGRVRVSVNTHSVEGLSPYDFELARRIEAIR